MFLCCLAFRPQRTKWYISPPWTRRRLRFFQARTMPPGYLTAGGRGLPTPSDGGAASHKLEL